MSDLEATLFRARHFVTRSQSLKDDEHPWHTTCATFAAGEIDAMTQEITRLRADNAALREALAKCCDELEAAVAFRDAVGVRALIAKYRKLLAPTETGGGE